jgi:hypothetical protein
MRVALFRMLGLLIAVAVALPAAAQFGHPLKGSWSGDWGPDKDNRTRVLIDIGWDGKALNGVINPGAAAIPLQKATLDLSNWVVHFEAERKDASGQTVRYVIDGKLENIGAAQRFITGTWTEGARKGSFKIIRN